MTARPFRVETAAARLAPRLCVRAGRAFTLVEMMVAVALLALVMVMVSQVFTMSGEAAGRTTAQAEVISASSALREKLSADLDRMAPGLLVIECPPPLLDRIEVPGGSAIIPIRHDRLAFISAGSAGRFQSFTDPTRGYFNPADPLAVNLTPASSDAALLYYGPGITATNASGAPLVESVFLNDTSIPAVNWALARRAILLLNQRPLDNGQNTAWRANLPMVTTGATRLLDLLNGNPFAANNPFRLGLMDAAVSDDPLGRPADPQALTNIVEQNYIALSSAPDTPAPPGLWGMNWCPPSASQRDSAVEDHYTRSGFTFMPGLVDLRIEWTDGRQVNPPVDQRTRWYGLKPDPTSNPPASLSYRPDPSFQAGSAFEVFQTGAGARYRAIWRPSTWHLRPKAIRLTYRIYDASRRLSESVTTDFDEDGDPDPDGPAADLIKRYGHEFSVVFPIP